MNKPAGGRQTSDRLLKLEVSRNHTQNSGPTWEQTLSTVQAPRERRPIADRNREFYSHHFVVILDICYAHQHKQSHDRRALLSSPVQVQASGYSYLVAVNVLIG
jgi:hypothetical protein